MSDGVDAPRRHRCAKVAVLNDRSIKLITTPYCVIRNPAAALKAMPANLREQCLEIDLTCAPELVPGLERAYDRDPRSAFLSSDLVRPYDRKIEREDYIYGVWSLPTARTLIAAPILAVFFAVATVYRLYVKAAAVLYLPLLLIDLPVITPKIKSLYSPFFLIEKTRSPSFS